MRFQSKDRTPAAAAAPSFPAPTTLDTDAVAAGVISRSSVKARAVLALPILAIVAGSVFVHTDLARLRTGITYRPLNGVDERAVALDSASVIPLDRVAPVLVLAIVASEDRRFFHHHGFDAAEMRAAILDTWRTGKPLRGASTISQQLIKNIFLGDARTFSRKLREALYTAALEMTWSKADILRLYLNEIEWGDGIYGVTTATQRYFRADPAAVTLPQAALLSAVLPAPRIRGRGLARGSMHEVGTWVVRRRLQRLHLVVTAIARPGRALTLDDVVTARLDHIIDPAETNGYPTAIRRAAHRDLIALRRTMRATRTPS